MKFKILHRLRKPSATSDESSTHQGALRWQRWFFPAAGILAVGFVLFYLLGFVLGRSASPPEQKLVDVAAGHLRLEYVPERDQLLLTYECGSAKTSHRHFDVARNALLPQLTYRSVTQSGRWNAWQSHRDVALALLGTGTFAAALSVVNQDPDAEQSSIRARGAGHVAKTTPSEESSRRTWPKALKESKPAKLFVAVAVAVGTVTGYLVGFDHGTRSALDCDTESVDSFVSNPESWRLLKRRYVEMQLTLITVPQSPAERDRMRADSFQILQSSPISHPARSTPPLTRDGQSEPASSSAASSDFGLHVAELLMSSERAFAAYHRLVSCHADIAVATEQLKAELMSEPDKLPGRSEFATIYLLQASVRAAVRGAMPEDHRAQGRESAEFPDPCDAFKARMQAGLLAQSGILPLR